MEPNIQIFQYNGNDIEFELTSHSVMVNATEMAKVFGKQTQSFLRNQQTVDYINACCKDENYYRIMRLEIQEDDYDKNSGNENSRFQSRKKDFVKVIKGGAQGTWMHRVLALKFAAWLNADFELWVYMTIENLLFGAYREVDSLTVEIFKTEAKIKDLETVYQREVPTFFEYKRLITRRDTLKKKRTVKVNNAPTFFD